MTFLSPQNTSSSRYFVPACFGLVVATFLSVLHINIPGGNVSLLLLPLLMVSLWPSGVNGVVSVLILFSMGVFMDWGTNGALGQWSIIYLTVFTILRPDKREGVTSFIGALALWFIGLAVGGLMLIVTGWLVYGVLPNFTVLFRQALLISILMPLIVLIRNVTRYWMTDPSERDY